MRTTISAAGRAAVLAAALLAGSPRPAETTGCVDAPNAEFASGAKYNCFGQRWDAIPDGLIPVAENATWVNFASNRLTSLPAIVFGTYATRRTDLQYIELQNNLISTIPSGVFNALTRLRHLNLAQNGIWAIQRDFFATIPTLTALRHTQLLMPAGGDANMYCVPSTINDRTYVQCSSCGEINLRLFVDQNLDSCCIPSWQELCFTESPSAVPTSSPTSSPTVSPSLSPSTSPSTSPTASPSVSPTWFPTVSPSTSPTASPTMFPTTSSPSASPTMLPTTSEPTKIPTKSPTTAAPTANPTTTRPTVDQETWPPSTAPTASPTVVPSVVPSSVPSTSRPTTLPTVRPTGPPTVSPTRGLMFPLALAAMLGERRLVDLLLDDGAVVNMADGSGTTALLYAAQAGELEVVQRLVANGARHELLTNDGTSVLIAAAGGGSVSVMGFALDVLSANLLESRDDGATAMHVAAQNGHTGAMSLLVNRSSSVRQMVRGQMAGSGLTPLLLAAQGGHTAAAELVLNNGADIDHTNSDGATALVLAAQGGHVDVVALILARADSAVGGLALIEAARNGHLGVVSTLLAASVGTTGIDRTDYGVAAAAAASRNHSAVLDRLMALNGAANSTLMVAVNPDMEPFLLNLAAGFGLLSAVESLLGQGAAVDQTDPEAPNSATPICLAAAHGHAAVAAALAAAGAALEQDCGNGESPLATAARTGAGAVVVALRALNATIDTRDFAAATPLINAAASGHADVVGVLVGLGANLEAVTSAGHSALLAAAAGGHDVAVAALLEAGADIETAMATTGQNALQLALVHGRSAVLRVLLSRSASTDALFEDNTTAARYALLAAGTGHLELLAQLLVASDPAVVVDPCAAPAPDNSGLLPSGGCDRIRAHQCVPSTDGFAACQTACCAIIAANANAANDTTARPPPRPPPPSVLLLPEVLLAGARGGFAEVVNLAIDLGAAVDVLTDIIPAVVAGDGDGDGDGGGGVDSPGPAPTGGRSALIIAASLGHTAAAEALLVAGANANLVDAGGVSALLAAVQNGHGDTVVALQGASGAVVDVANVNGTTPLLAAAAAGQTAIVAQLLANAASAATADSTGATPLLAAARAGHGDVVAVLLAQSGVDDYIDVADASGTTALWAAAKARYFAVVTQLLLAGACIDGVCLQPPTTTPAPSIEVYIERNRPQGETEAEATIAGLGLTGPQLIITGTVIGALMTAWIVYRAIKPAETKDDKTPKDGLPTEEMVDLDEEYLPDVDAGNHPAGLMVPGSPSHAGMGHANGGASPGSGGIILVPAGYQVMYQDYQTPQGVHSAGASPLPMQSSPSPAKNLADVKPFDQDDFGMVTMSNHHNPSVFGHTLAPRHHPGPASPGGPMAMGMMAGGAGTTPAGAAFGHPAHGPASPGGPMAMEMMAGGAATTPAGAAFGHPAGSPAGRGVSPGMFQSPDFNSHA